MAFSWGYTNYRKLNIRQATEKILERNDNRTYFYSILVKLCCVVKERGLRMIVENPWSEQTYLKANFIMSPTLVDMNRMLRGDYYVKPTAYWFIHCEPTQGLTIQKDKTKKTIMKSKGGSKAGICSEERSMISPDYARNFICDFILGKKQGCSQMTLDDFM